MTAVLLMRVPTPVPFFLTDPDGTVLLGTTLFQDEKNRVGESETWSMEAIAAHEFGHILQYKLGMTPDGPWQMEPHADFIAGWYLWGQIGHSLGQKINRTTGKPLPNEELLEMAIRSFFQIGDYAFNDHTHHGEPEFRAAMVRAGFESGNLKLNEAFEKGKKYAGLT